MRENLSQMFTKNVKLTMDPEGSVSGILHVPADFVSGEGTGIILAHGAGKDMHAPLLLAFAQGMAASGYLVLRFNFLYKEKGKKAPDPPRRLQKAWRAAYDFLSSHSSYAPGHILGAGKSMGGRIASQMAAAGELPVDGLIFLGYPLHPPGNKAKIRDAHLYGIAAPMLFFAGTRDSLCDLDLLRPVLSKLSAPHALHIIETGDHSFNVLKSQGRSREEVFAEIVRASAEWVATDVQRVRE